jgi:hypothetical protein
MVEQFDHQDLKIIAMRCGSPGKKINMDMILKLKEPLYWHRSNNE